MYSDQLYRRNGPFSGSSPDSIIGLSSKRGCLTGSSLVPMTTREADDEEPAPEPQPTRSPPAAAVPAISLSASRRDMRRQGDLSLGWNATSINLLLGRPAQTAPSLPLGRELLLGLPFLTTPPRRVRLESQLPGRRVQTHLVDQFSVHRRVAEQYLEREAVH